MLAVALSSNRRVAPEVRAWQRFAHLAAGVLSSAILLASFAALAEAQNVVFNGTLTVANNDKSAPSFQLPDQSNEYKDALEEFRRMVEHEQWEKAFQALDTISKNTKSGFANRGDGVLVPSRLLVRSLMADLPSAGKSAYRLFYDSQASSLWNEATGKAELEKLAAIVNQYAVSSLGDRAADRLGDMQFERGDFEQAVDAWRTILACRPDSALPRAQTLVKIATALARADRWTEFRDVEQDIRQQYADEPVTIGGQQLTAVDAVRRLAESARDGDSAAPSAALADGVELPQSNEPAWRFSFASKPAQQSPGANPFNMVDVYGRQRANDFVIPAACDDQRVYVNVLGIEMAFDLKTGKLLWRTGQLHLLNLQQARQGVSPERYAIGVAGDRVWSVSRDVNDQRGAFRLHFREAATGKELFSSRRTLSSWSFLGAPYFVGERVYAGAHRHGAGRELSLLLLNDAGKLEKTISIGNYAVDQSQIHYDAAARPTFAVYRDRLFVDTHGGAVVAVDPAVGVVDWAVLYDSPSPVSGYYYNYFPRQHELGGPLLAGGLLFCKGMRSSRLLGIVPSGPTLAWNRPVLDSSTLVAADDERVYLGGKSSRPTASKTNSSCGPRRCRRPSPGASRW